MYSIFDIISFPCTFVRSFTAFPSTQLNALLLRRNKLRACKVGNACYTYIRFLTLFTFLGMCIFPISILLKECDIWYSALVHKSSVRAFLLITFNLLKKTILSSKLFLYIAWNLHDYIKFKILKYIFLFAVYPYSKFLFLIMMVISYVCFIWIVVSIELFDECRKKSLIDENLSS